jgi:hypothetical protein
MVKRAVLTVVFVVHGLIHVLGFAVYWKLATIEGLSYGNRLLSGSLEVGEAGARVLVAGVAVLLLRPWWRPLTFGVALLSLAITVLGWPDSWFGVLVNLAILAYLFVGGKRGWLPGAVTVGR